MAEDKTDGHVEDSVILAARVMHQQELKTAGKKNKQLNKPVPAVTKEVAVTLLFACDWLLAQVIEC